MAVVKDSGNGGGGNYWNGSSGEKNGQRQIRVNGKMVGEEEFRQMARNNQVASGPGGTAVQRAIDSGTYADPYAGQQSPGGGGGTGNTPGASPTSPPAPNDPPFIGAPPAGGNYSDADKRRHGVYGMRMNENMGDWAKRAFEQGAADFGPAALNPNAMRNPMADSPGARYFSQRYGNTLPSNSLINMLLNGNSAGTDPTVGMQDLIRQGMQTGQGLGTPDNYQQQMRDILGMIQRAKGNDFTHMNDFQEGMSRKLLNDPYAGLQLILSQLQGTTGGFGFNEMTNAYTDEARNYFNDPLGAENQATPFFQRALQKLGWA